MPYFDVLVVADYTNKQLPQAACVKNAYSTVVYFICILFLSSLCNVLAAAFICGVPWTFRLNVLKVLWYRVGFYSVRPD